MSKKSIMFRMPAREAAPSEHQDIPAVRPEVSEDAPASDSQPDQWVEHRNSGPFAAPAPIPSTTFRPAPRADADRELRRDGRAKP